MAVVAANAKNEFLKALDEAVGREFKAFAREFVDPKTKLAWAWDLGCGVDIHVVGRESDHVRVFVARSDVVHRHNRDNEQKVFRVRAGEKLSKIIPIMVMARVYLKENQQKLAVHEANMKAWKKELGSLDIPDSITVVREPTTGTYLFELKLRYAECPPRVIKKAVKAAKALFRTLE